MGIENYMAVASTGDVKTIRMKYKANQELCQRP